MAGGKPCKVCNFTRQKSYGLVVPSLDELKAKGCESLGFTSSSPVTVVLEDDGTIVEDQAYFLCLPINTKFMLLHEKETWSPVRKTDSVDASVPPWRALAQQLKADLASIILMSEADLQTLVDVPCPELASALGFPEKKAADLQETLQRSLDRREEERQSKELLELYLKALHRQEQQDEGPSQASNEDGMEVDSASGFMSRTLMVLKGKTSPETRLSTEDLQMVVNRGVEAMEQVLACEAELTKRLQQIQAVQSIRSSSTQQTSADSPVRRAQRTAKKHHYEC
uniref:DNA fragmentation factor, alpha polypeptide n=1 Tax=Sphaeramia orbicularis TaxID=375764 RepID=A0A672ZIW8_9TELE